jgi:hypothetical protein
VAQILGKLGDSLEWQHLETDLKKLHEEHVTHALYFMSLLEQASLQKLYSELEVGTSYKHETLRFVVLVTLFRAILVLATLLSLIVLCLLLLQQEPLSEAAAPCWVPWFHTAGAKPCDEGNLQE